MTQRKQTDHPVSLALATNLTLALKVAGPTSDNINPTKLTKTHIQRTTGVARSTLREIAKMDSPCCANPDLHTLCRIADELHVPVAFLLMGPTEWRALLKAFMEIETDDFESAASYQEREKGLRNALAAFNILKFTRVYPLPKPKGAAEQDVLEVAALEQKNEAFRRAALVMGALLQQAANEIHSLKKVTKLAASYANNDKSRFLSSL